MKRISFSLGGLLSYMYLAAAALITFAFPLSDRIKSLIAQPALLLIPYLVGKPILALAGKILSLKENNDTVVELTVSWSLGIVFIVTLEAILYVNYAFSLDSFIVILAIIGLMSIFIRRNTSPVNPGRLEIIFVMLYGLAFSLIITRFWPYPLANANDYITHTFDTVQIVTKGRPLFFYPDYLPAMDTLYALMMRGFNINPYNEPLFLLWSSRFILYPVYAVGFYLLALKLTESKLFSLIAAVIGSSLLCGIQANLFPYHTAPKNFLNILFFYGFYTALSLRPKEATRRVTITLLMVGITIAAMLIPLFLTDVNGTIGYEIGFILPVMLILVLILTRIINVQERNLFLSLILVSAGMMFIHKLPGAIAAEILVGFLFLTLFFRRFNGKWFRLLTAVSVLITLGTIALFMSKVIPYPASPLFDLRPDIQTFFGLDNLLNYLNSIYPPVLIYLFAAGTILPIFLKGEKASEFQAASVLASGLMFIYFLPVFQSYRFLNYAHPLIIILATLAIFKLTRTCYIHNNKYSLRVLYPVAIVLVFIGLTIYGLNITTLTKGEVVLYQKLLQVFELGNYMKEHADKDALVITRTPYNVLSANLGLFPTFQRVKGRGMIDTLIEDMYKAETADEAYEKARELINGETKHIRASDKDGKDLERFYKQPSEVIILYDDYGAVTYGSSDKFFDKRFFDLIFLSRNNAGARFYVFKVKPEPSSGYSNLVKNPSFEEGIKDVGGLPKGWAQNSEAGTAALDTTMKKDGDNSWRIAVDVAKEKTWGVLRSEDIVIEGGKSYVFSVSMKTQNAVKSLVSVDYYDSKAKRNVSLVILPTGTVAADTDWGTYTKYFDVPEDVKTVQVYLMGGWAEAEVNGSALTWFDDIKLIGPIEISMR